MFKSNKNGESPTLKIPNTTRVYTIADIHGRSDLLIRTLKAIAKDAQPYPNQRRLLITLGDYIDRGPSSYQVIDLLCHLPLTNFETKHLKGNHEAMLVDFLANPIDNGILWLSNGGYTTLLSYGFSTIDLPDTIEKMPDARDKLLNLMPSKHLHFFKSLRLNYHLGDYYFVHAGIRPGISLDNQVEDDLIWIRKEFLHSQEDFGKIIVHGHSISSTPQELNNRIGLDTGAFHTGIMTCLVLQGEDRYFLQINENVNHPIKINHYR